MIVKGVSGGSSNTIQVYVDSIKKNFTNDEGFDWQNDVFTVLDFPARYQVHVLKEFLEDKAVAFYKNGEQVEISEVFSEEFKTPPPVGTKRTRSTTSSVTSSVYEDRISSLEKSNKELLRSVSELKDIIINMQYLKMKDDSK